MLILLPPSEGKHAPRRGNTLDVDKLSNPSLNPTRLQVKDALVSLCHADAATAISTLGLTPGLASEVDRNANLHRAPTATAARVYTGVLYDALGLDSLSRSAKRRATSRVAVTSSLFGLVRLGDRIPAYRLSGDVTLPGLGTVASIWRQPLATVLGPAAESGLVVDLRSGMYRAFWRPTARQSGKVVTVRVLHEIDGRRSVVSHFNKATKGRIVRGVLEDGSNPTSPAGFARLLMSLGWVVEPTPGTANGYDVVVTQV